ncbi:MAG: UDP-glucose/GDP-mannose dehydrogenase family protein [Armatimonadetes bacterium]|nr:UDP-glucose/GDP-mannose dehydrogenase family protein [Armatimonadota bacterium]
MNLCVIGTGYVGLVTGTVFADLGNTVICIDKDESKIDMLDAGRMPIYEPGLEEMVERNRADGRLSFSTDIGFGVRESDVVFIAVGTPTGNDGYADLTAIREVAVIIARNLHRYKVIVNKSTVPVGTGDLVREIIEEHKERPDIDFDVVSNPEFLREGNAINDTLYPDRIVIGAPSQNVAMRILELYAPLERPMIITDVYSAEMIKYASNAFLATKISFINAIANICEAANADVLQVAKGMGYDKRIGADFLNAGLGYGGSCFGKDTSCLVSTAEKLGCNFALLKNVIEINAEQPRRFVDKIRAVLGGLEGKTVGVLGLAFKPNTDDLRDAKSLEIIAQLLAERATVRAYDPIAMDNTRGVFPQIEYCSNAYEAAEASDAVAVITEWNEFKFLDLARVKETMRQPIIFDGRNIYDPERMRRLGFDYYCVGRPPVTSTRITTHV